MLAPHRHERSTVRRLAWASWTRRARRK
jgi:hypothetical protein